MIGRLEELLRSAKKGYRDTVEDLKRPRGRILWADYTSERMPAGKWDTLPCRYSDLSVDPKVISCHARAAAGAGQGGGQAQGKSGQLERPG